MYDDCSTDNCAEKATRLGFKVIRGSTNKRQSAARNILLRNSTGNMVHFHDHDDPIHPRFVEQMLVHAGRDSVVICNFERIDKKAILHAFGSDYLQNPYKLVFDGYVHLNAMIACRDLALRSGGFDEMLTLSEEKDFLFKLLRAGARVVLLPETLATWKVQETSFMCAQGWPAAAIMTRRFIANCTSVAETPIVPQMLEYASGLHGIATMPMTARFQNCACCSGTCRRRATNRGMVSAKRCDGRARFSDQSIVFVCGVHTVVKADRSV